MNMSTSECESGWTMYLDNSWSYVGVKQHGEEEDGDEDDDLSMVSDASSGPRQKFDEDDEGKLVCGERKKTRSKKEKRFGDVDDTASSPVFTSTSKSKSRLFFKASSTVEKCPSNKQGAYSEVTMKKGRDSSAQGSRELGSTNVIARRLNLKY